MSLRPSGPRGPGKRKLWWHKRRLYWAEPFVKDAGLTIYGLIPIEDDLGDHDQPAEPPTPDLGAPGSNHAERISPMSDSTPLEKPVAQTPLDATQLPAVFYRGRPIDQGTCTKNDAAAAFYRLCRLVGARPALHKRDVGGWLLDCDDQSRCAVHEIIKKRVGAHLKMWGAPLGSRCSLSEFCERVAFAEKVVELSRRAPSGSVGA